MSDCKVLQYCSDVAATGITDADEQTELLCSKVEGHVQGGMMPSMMEVQAWWGRALPCEPTAQVSLLGPDRVHSSAA